MNIKYSAKNAYNCAKEGIAKESFQNKIIQNLCFKFLKKKNEINYWTKHKWFFSKIDVVSMRSGNHVLNMISVTW